MSHTGSHLGSSNPMSLEPSLEMNIHVMSLINLLKIGGIGLDFIITIGRNVEEMAIMTRIEMPIMLLREIGISSIEEQILKERNIGSEPNPRPAKGQDLRNQIL